MSDFKRWEVSDYPAYDFAPHERDVLLATGEQVCTAYAMQGGETAEQIAQQIAAEHNEVQALRQQLQAEQERSKALADAASNLLWELVEVEAVENVTIVRMEQAIEVAKGQGPQEEASGER